jgi:menaquinone-dependent protoporphyrinogen oxidase
MHILLLYGTSEGQTRKIADFVAERLRALGHDVVLRDVMRWNPPVHAADFDAVIVAARVHAGSYQRQIVAFARANRTVLERLPNAFLSVSMSAARLTPGDEARLARYVTRFIRRSAWRPEHVLHVAGARLYLRHNFIGRAILRLVDGNRFDVRQNHEWTDWPALEAFAEGFDASLRNVILPTVS